jgi:putative CocE/NonD family hydrolase
MSLLSLATALASRLPARRSAKVRVERSLSVPMRDGVRLLADRWFAPDLEPGPVVLVRSPYGRGASFSLVARLFAERGLQCVLQSCRGTSGSGGRFDPMRQEQADGLDTLEWTRAQPWFTGQLFTFGGSYLGYTQWAMAGAAGERIDAMALQVTLSNFRNETLAFGGFTQAGALEWTRFMQARATPRSLWSRMMRPTPNRAAIARIHAHLPLRELDTLAVGTEVSWWQDWVGHGEPSDPWWKAIDHSADVAAIRVPAVMIGGWRDIFLPWQVKDFEAMQDSGREVWLTIGPWAHASPGGSAESLRQALSLFGALRDGRRPLPERDRVRLYVHGADRWNDYASWPPPGFAPQRLYLHSSAALWALAPSTASDPTRFVYDPRDPTPAVHGPRLIGGITKPDMSALERRRDTVAFTSAPLTSDLEAIGPVRAEVYVRSDRLHTDFYVCLCDVDPAGRPLQVVDGYLRLRPGEPAGDGSGARRIEIECWPTAWRFRRAHRLRLIVASGAHPRYARNLGTGEPLGTGTRMLSARQEILHDPAHPSALCLTLGAPIDGLP